MTKKELLRASKLEKELGNDLVAACLHDAAYGNFPEKRKGLTMKYGPKYSRKIGGGKVFLWISPTTDIDRTKISSDNVEIRIFRLTIRFSWARK